MKVLRPLFLDKLEDALEKAKGKPKQLEKLLQRVRDIKVFDPACGSGNFLIIAFKELRKLEMRVLEALNDSTRQNILIMPGVQIQNFYGIEIDDFAHEIALLALWLAEHQMNMAFLDKFGHYEPTLPLKASGNIALGNALSLDWMTVCRCTPADEVYVCGNPPFLGSKGTSGRTDLQNTSMSEVFSNFGNWRSLDLVAAWFWQGAKYIYRSKNAAEIAFVATNSIFQGEQVSLLWPSILDVNVSISFAYPAFKWKNNAKDGAGVHVAIVGLSGKSYNKYIYREIDGDLRVNAVRNISPYLTSGSNTVVKARSRPFKNASRMIDGNNYNKCAPLILSSEEKSVLIAKEPKSEKWIKRLLGADEFLNGKERWCLWLVDIDQEGIDNMPFVKKRVDEVKQQRLLSKDPGTKKIADRPHQFRDLNNPEKCILVPRVTSERRKHAPVGYIGKDTITTNQNLMIPDGSLFEFGFLMTSMHMDWLHLVGGRLKSDFRYSSKLVYNTFPWPDCTPKQRTEIEALADEVLLAREDTFDWTMAEMYDPDKMPSALREVHRNLDEAVEQLYRRTPFRDQAERQEFLLARYEKLIKQEAGVSA